MTPSFSGNPPDSVLRELLAGSLTIAMVGASSKADRPSNRVMRRLLAAGYHVIPVSPRETEVCGQHAYASLAAVPERIDIVDVFRRAEETPSIADEAAKIGAKVLWLQLGISSDEAAARATAAGLMVVMDKCLGQTIVDLGLSKPKAVVRDRVDEAGDESFPASDPPSWTSTHSGGPDA